MLIWSEMKLSHVNVVRNQCDLKQRDFNSRSPKWMFCQMVWCYRNWS